MGIHGLLQVKSREQFPVKIYVQDPSSPSSDCSAKEALAVRQNFATGQEQEESHRGCG